MDGEGVLERITSIIQNRVEPERIILFGSRASNSFSPYSDYDICVVVKNLMDERQLTRQINRDIYNSNLEVPVDLIAVDLDKYEQNKASIGFIYKQIQDSGIVVYGS